MENIRYKWEFVGLVDTRSQQYLGSPPEIVLAKSIEWYSNLTTCKNSSKEKIKNIDYPCCWGTILRIKDEKGNIVFEN